MIVDSLDGVYAAILNYKNSRIRHILKREYDYIQELKDFGYRSYHMVYQSHSDKKETYNKDMLIEIQFRTKLQHTWAITLEMTGICTKSQLKAGISDKDVLRLFVLVSSVFAKMEYAPIVPNTIDDCNKLTEEIKSVDKNHHILEKLEHLSYVTHYMNKSEMTKRKFSYYLLIMNSNYKEVKIHIYSSKEAELVISVYNKIEKTGNDYLDTVLASTTSIDSLKIAYPNYFTDIPGFIEMMKRILA